MGSTPFNSSALYGSDVRNVLSGKDAQIFDEGGALLATVDSFQAQVTFNTANYQPLGSPIVQAFQLGYQVSITISQCVVESDAFITDIFEYFEKGRHSPAWTLRGVLNGYDGSEESIVFRDCVPDGTFDVGNYTVGDIIKRNMTLRCNQMPELQSTLSRSD